nr:MAG TPA: hypothetical protein [Caudoviricetes sp.]
MFLDGLSRNSGEDPKQTQPTLYETILRTTHYV